MIDTQNSGMLLRQACINATKSLYGLFPSLAFRAKAAGVVPL
jgi:hypothetical protein